MSTQLESLDVESLSTLALIVLDSDLDAGGLTTVLAIDTGRVQTSMDSARGSGLLNERGELLPAARSSLTAALGENRIRALARQLLSYHLDGGTLTISVARAVTDTGVTDPALVEFLCTQAELADASSAATLYADAARAGGDSDAMTLQHAEVAALSGDLDTAVALADSILERSSSVTDSELAAAVRISASGAAYCGMLDRSAALYAWLGSPRTGSDAPVAASVLLTAGRVDEAERILGADADSPPTAVNAGATLVAAGLLQSLTGSASIAVNSLTRSLTLPGRSTRPRMMPDSSAAITALAAIHCGELAHADAVLSRACDGDRPDSITWNRHQLLSAWTSMIRGDLVGARTRVEALHPSRMHQRDLLFVHALRVGLARRTGDNTALLQAWAGARGVIAEYSVDLLSLLPLGELWLAAIRMGEAPRISHLVDAARELLRQLGEPAIWASALHWYGVQASILAECPGDLIPHARALGDAAKVSAYAAGLADAGRAWLRVLQGDIDAGSVEDAARTLDRIGLPWDGARLAGEAALRVADTRAATALLQVARDLRQPATASPRTEPTVDAPLGSLTEREGEVADLLVMGLTYREMGSRLYISAKTIEHHVARIRRRLGAQSRSELLSMLRAMGHGQA